jgi:WD40 repeat protein
LALSLLSGHAPTVRVWDCQAGAFATPALKHPEPALTLAFDPQSRRLATGCRDHTARVFAVPGETGDPLFRPVPHGQVYLSWWGYRPFAPQFLAGGRELLTLTRNNELAWRSGESGAVLRRVSAPAEEQTLPNTAAVSPDGRYFVVAGRDGAQMWDVAAARPVGPLLKNRALQVTVSAAFSPDGRTLLTGCSDSTLRRWAVPGGQPLGKPLPQPTMVNLVAFSPDGRFLAAAQRGGQVRVWAPPADDPRHYSIPLDGADSLAKVSRDGRYLMASGATCRTSLRATRVYEVATGRPAGPPLPAGGVLMDAAFSPDGRCVAMLVGHSPRAGQVKLCDWRTGKPACDPLSLPSLPLCLDYSPDGQRLAVLCRGGQLLLLNPGRGRITGRWQAYPGLFSVAEYSNNGMTAFSPDGRSVLTYGIDSRVRVWDAATGEERYDALRHTKRCHDVQFSPDGRLLATSSYDNTVRIWDLATGRPAAEPLRHPDWVFTAPFSPDGGCVLTACRDGMARLWNWRNGRLVCPAFEHEHEVHAVAFHPDGRRVLTVSDDRTLRVWEWRTGKPVTPPLATGAVGLSLTVTPGGNHVAVGGFTDALRVFHLGDLSVRGDPDDLCVWGEVVSGQRVLPNGGVTNLTADEWLDRWRHFRTRHPGHVQLEPSARGPERGSP